MWIPREVWQEFKSELHALRERCDRLTEAVAHQQGVPVRMPMPQSQVNRPLEKLPGWFENINPTVKALAKSLNSGDRK